MSEEFEFPSQSAADGSRGLMKSKPKKRNSALFTSDSLVINAGGVRLWDAEESMSEEPSEKESQRQRVILYEEVTEAFAAIREGLKDVEAVDNLKARIAKIVARANESARIGQTGLSRDLMEAAAGLIVEQQALALGYGRWLDEQTVTEVVRQTAPQHRLSLCRLSEFPRIIPNDVQGTITKLKDIFSQFMIVFTNPRGEKVKDRDPILFGVIRAFPDRYYFIKDWEDAYCDLTLDKFLLIGNEVLHQQWVPNQAPVEPTDADLQALVLHVRDGHTLNHIEMTWFGRFMNWIMNRHMYKGPEE